ncbi:hypothetical protein MHTCC0001_02420 [Flavobacteriaceae bacterium MHTCC 0001]
MSKIVRNIKTIGLISFVLLLNSCFFLFDSGGEKIIGNYKILWVDLLEQQVVCESLDQTSSSCSVLVKEYVFAVGHNSDFIIAKQHPTNGFDNGHVIDTTITNFYIIDINRKLIKKGNKVFGPLTESQFNDKVTELDIEKIKFDQVYPHLPS